MSSLEPVSGAIANRKASEQSHYTDDDAHEPPAVKKFWRRIKWLFALNAVLAIASGFQAYFAYRSNELTRASLDETRKATSAAVIAAKATENQLPIQIRQLDLATDSMRTANESATAALAQAREQFIADQQPYVWVLSVEPERSTAGVPIDSDGRLADGRVAWRLSWRNFGKSPAVDFGTRANLFIGADAMNQANDYILKQVQFRRGLGVLPPGSDGGFTSLVSNTRHTRQDLSTITKRDFGIVLIGRFEYKDLSQTFYQNDFCYGLLASGLIAHCGPNNVIRKGKRQPQPAGQPQ